MYLTCSHFDIYALPSKDWAVTMLPHGVCWPTMLNPPTLSRVLADIAITPKFHGLDPAPEDNKNA